MIGEDGTPLNKTACFENNDMNHSLIYKQDSYKQLL